jgi:hypothetical protein
MLQVLVEVRSLLNTLVFSIAHKDSDIFSITMATCDAPIGSWSSYESITEGHQSQSVGELQLPTPHMSPCTSLLDHRSPVAQDSTATSEGDVHISELSTERTAFWSDIGEYPPFSDRSSDTSEEHRHK